MSATIFGLTCAQVNELRMIRDEDGDALARGDWSGLVGVGLAKVPASAGGYYMLTTSGREARQAVIDRFGALR